MGTIIDSNTLIRVIDSWNIIPDLQNVIREYVVMKSVKFDIIRTNTETSIRWIGKYTKNNHSNASYTICRSNAILFLINKENLYLYHKDRGFWKKSYAACEFYGWFDSPGRHIRHAGKKLNSSSNIRRKLREAIGDSANVMLSYFKNNLIPKKYGLLVQDNYSIMILENYDRILKEIGFINGLIREYT